jgi:perosamine synthetase
MIPISKPSITKMEIDYVTDAVSSTWISSLGPYIDRFEKEFAFFCDSKYAVSLMNGTVAIQLALDVCGIKPGDEVIVPNLSFIATANAVLYLDAIPVFVDIEPFTYCMDAEKLEEAITPKTKAIIPVHLYGHPADMIKINAIAKKHNLIVIEDAAEAHGATINGQKVGSWSNCATFSFYGNKNLTTGEGGMITTNDEEIYNKCKYLRDHAMSKEKRYWHTERGYNFRMTNLQAALGCAQLDRSHEILTGRNRIFEEYYYELGKCDGIVLNNTKDWATNAFWLVTARFDGYTELNRDLLMDKLHKKGIDSRPFFYPMSSMPYLSNVNVNTPVTDKISQEGINLPTFLDLSSKDIKYICNAIKELI